MYLKFMESPGLHIESESSGLYAFSMSPAARVAGMSHYFARSDWLKPRTPISVAVGV
jgi:hypothetical protein